MSFYAEVVNYYNVIYTKLLEKQKILCQQNSAATHSLFFLLTTKNIENII